LGNSLDGEALLTGMNWMTVMVGIKEHRSFTGSLDVINVGTLGPFRFSDRVNALDSDTCK